MSEKQGWGRTVLGWFVVQDGQQAGSLSEAPAGTGADADELIRKYAGAADTPPPAPPVALKGPLPPVVEGQVDLIAVYESAGVDAQERDRVNKAQELLRSLPAETPIPVKKQIVEASLKAFGVPTEQIIEAAVQEMEALESFILAGQADVQNTLQTSNQLIADYEAKITEIRGLMQEAVTTQQTRAHLANNEKLRIQEVLEFFGQEAVARVVHASPKLHEPK